MALTATLPLTCLFLLWSRFLLALTAGVPVTVFYRYERSKLALAWREWMTKRVMEVICFTLLVAQYSFKEIIVFSLLVCLMLSLLCCR